MIREDIYKYIDNGFKSNKDIDALVLKNMIAKYPYFEAIIFLYLKQLYLTDSKIFKEELNQLSIFISDRRSLFYYIFSEEFKIFFEKTGKSEITSNKTDILLKAFFQSKEDASDLNDNELEYSLSHSSMATTDYFSYLHSLEENKTSNSLEPKVHFEQQNIIDNFIKNTETNTSLKISPAIVSEEKNANNIPENIKKSTEDALDEDMFFTETLAKIYIKQKKYEKAHKIIQHLNLNYPKKNIYFADQLSFLEKLIINSKSKK